MSHFLESVRDNPNAMTAKAVAVVGSSLAFLAGLYWLKRNEHECATRRGTLQCFCGQVVVDLYQPAANYKYAEPVNMQCACHDCMDYCEAVLKEGKTSESFCKGFFDPAVPTMLFYDSELSVTRGKEHLESIKLSIKTENRRIFASCCGTPIAIAPEHSYLNLVYSNLIRSVPQMSCQEKEVPYPMSVVRSYNLVLHAENLNLDENATKDIQSKHPSMKIIPTVVAPVEISKILGRLVLLLALGSSGPGEGFPMGQGKAIGYGIESISKKMK